MKKLRYVVLAVVVVGAVSVAALALAQEAASSYVGVAKCKICHSKAKMGGAEYLKWETESHPKAFTDLSSDKAVTAAKAMGIAEPAKSEKCLKCHVTDVKTTDTYSDGVGCERCHGAGSNYKTMETMKNYDAAVKAGMRDIKGKPAEAEKLCKECHGLEHKAENPFAKEFKYDEYWPKIKHDKASLQAEFPDAFK